jgi:hypothetical protein
MGAQPLPTTLLQDRLPDWWRPLALDLDGQRLELRRAGVTALREALTRANAVDAVAYAFGDEAAGARVIATVRAAARSADAAFAGDVGDAEPPALVAAALADLLAVEPDDDLSTLIALLIGSAAWSGAAPAIAGMRLPEYAVRQLEHRAAMTRYIPPLSAEPSLVEAVRAALAAESSDRVGSVRASQARALEEIAARIDEIAVRADAAHAVLREQLRIQTWVLESWCATAEADWRDVPAEARPLIAAVELAQNTAAVAPAIGAETLIGSILGAAGVGLGVETSASVAAAGPFLDGHLETAPHPALFPIASALTRWRGRSGPEAPPDPAAAWHEEVAIGMQAYREVLALRALGYE